MRKTILILNFLALSALSLTANFIFSPVDTQAQSSQAMEQQADREINPLAAPTGEPRAGRGTYFAAVNSSLERGTDVVEMIRVGHGEYKVTFGADISKCAYTATISTFSGPVGIATVAQTARPQTVIVRTHATDGFQSDRAFHLIVACS